MLAEIWEPGLTVVFAGAAVDELSDTLGFYHLQPRDRFWELLSLGGITPERIITKAERKALAEGHTQGSLSEPVRVLFAEKKTSRLVRLGIGLTDLNRRTLAADDKDKAARPSEEDLDQFSAKVTSLNPNIIAFITRAELFLELFNVRFPGATDILGPQPFKIGNAEVWLLGSPVSVLRGDALTKQEDTFFALGERIASLTQKRGKA